MDVLGTDTAEAAITITTCAEGGGLKDAIDAAGAGYLTIQNLTVTAGTLNLADCQFINRNLMNLITLEVAGTADFEYSTVPASAFKANKVLENVKLLHTATINESAFEECSNLLTADLPAVTMLNGRVFYNCYALKQASLPQLASMENRTFYRCTSLISLLLGEEPPALIGSYWFKEIISLKVFVPTQESILKYKDIYEFSDFKVKLVGDDSVDNDDESSRSYYDYKYDADLIYDYTGPYYTGEIKVGLNLYSFNANLNAWLTNGGSAAPPMDTLQAIRFAKEAGFDAVDVTAYYIPGYSNQTMPTKPHEEILQYAWKIKAFCKELDIEISGTGVGNNFADPRDEKRALDLERVKYWIDIAAEMGAPVIRLFSGNVPRDIMDSDWETIARDRIAPALRECTEYAAARGVKVGLQNHGDMTATAGQIIQIIKWVNHPNIGIINDTGYFRKFRSHNGLGYDWYSDIRAVLPYTNNFQLKTKPAGQETDSFVDLTRLFTDIRNSSYRGYVPIELLWRPGDPGHPNDLAEPPYEEIKQFLAKVKAAIHDTQIAKPL
ncbi:MULTISPECIES: TIM barrel protein [unclassified Paenibacillus]|uniref:TIM barrel protein n=1 Tax=unclassified Paenibacillus TaxID=185978 RepID=UPI00363308D2